MYLLLSIRHVSAWHSPPSFQNITISLDLFFYSCLKHQGLPREGKAARNGKSRILYVLYVHDRRSVVHYNDISFLI